MTELPFDITAALTEMGMSPIQNSFWTDGPIPDMIGYVTANSTAHMRLKLMKTHLHGEYPRDELLAMLCYYQHKKLKFSAPVAALKFKILKAASDKGVEWNEELDKNVEAAAWRTIRASKRKNPES